MENDKEKKTLKFEKKGKSKKCCCAVVLILVVIIVICALLATAVFFIHSNVQKTDDYIRNLEYNPAILLSYDYENEMIPSVSASGNFDRYVVVKRTKTPDHYSNDPSTLATTDNVIFPGNLLYADDNFLKGTPHALAADRNSYKITINLMGANLTSYEVKDGTYSGYMNALNTIIRDWFKSTSSHKVATRYSYKSTHALSANEISVGIGSDVSFFAKRIGLDRGFSTSYISNQLLIEFKQVYFTVSIDHPIKPSDMFSLSSIMSLSDLKHRISNSKVPMYVGSVDYGRVIYLLVKAEESIVNLKEAMNAGFGKGGISISANEYKKYENIYKKCECTLFELGGSTSTPLGLLTLENMNKVLANINNNPELTENNIPAPVSYTTYFLKDNAPAKLTSAFDRIEETYTVHKKILIKLQNSGVYNIQYHISWGEISFKKVKKDGQETLEEVYETVNWTLNGNSYVSGTVFNFYIPAMARNLEVNAHPVASSFTFHKIYKNIDFTQFTLVCTKDIFNPTFEEYFG